MRTASEIVPVPGETTVTPVRIYAAVRLLSLDVAMGALSGGLMVTAFLAQPIHLSWYVILPLSVWVIYTWDHLLDARRMGAAASTARHRFHHEHFRPLLVATLLGVILATFLAFVFLGSTGVFFGAGMGTFALVHFGFNRFVGGRTSPFLIKELGVGLIYSLGIWGFPLLESTAGRSIVVWIACGQFLLLALANLIEFSIFERELDEQDDHTSWVRAVGDRRSIQVVYGILLATVGLGGFVLLRFGSPSLWRLEVTYLAMTLVLAALLRRRDWFSQNERYRAWGDGAFLLPVLYRLLPW